ncbi:MAG: transketolase [Spirochaetes bacterium]|nr:transketolase [Spirochaetota bacterium]
MTNDDLRLIATTVRTLSLDAIQRANSGHPGMALGCADIAAVLWGKFLVHNPEDNRWANRDRFVLSAGHGSMLLYSLLHLFGYGITLEDIKKFRQLESRTPGHPEHRVTRGVETTTGPLGQGFANGIGMAIARDLFAREFNGGSEPVIDHRVYAIVSDGDIMEGISSEAASLAGHLGLGHLVYIYDSNGITIEGSTDLTFSEDVAKKFEAFHWHVQRIDGHDFDEIERALEAAERETARPSLIIARTTIARGSASMEGRCESHGAPLGEKEVFATKENLGCCGDDAFCVPDRAYQACAARTAEMKDRYDRWQARFVREITGDKKALWDRYFTAPAIDALRQKLPVFDPQKPIATRAASGKILEALFREMPNLVGGSADLGPSNNTLVKGYDETGRGTVGRNIHFGIREHAMGSIQNGIAYYGGFIPYSATFFTFMDYMRPAVRIAAIGGLQAVYVFTHDSVFVGEDGPTHQPVEHLAAARAIPNLDVVRPADAEETREAWLHALGRTEGPTLLALSRQNLPVLRSNGSSPRDLARGAYVLRGTDGDPDVVILASGSEVSISLEAAEILATEGIAARVVSFPSWEIFDRQPAEYRMAVLGHGIPKAVVEAGIRMGWDRYAGVHALYITRDDFGESAPYKVLAERYGFTGQGVAERIRGFVKKKTRK